MTSGTSTEAADVAGRLEALERELAELRDIEAIRGLKARYCNACDGDIVNGPSHDADAVAELYTEDATWTIAAIKTNELSLGAQVLDGREAIRTFFARAHKEIPFAMHFGISPLIDVDSDRATGHWHVLATMTLRGGRAFWIGGHYLDDYVRTEGGWLIANTVVVLGFNTPFEEGWHQTKYIRPRRG